jgi:peptide/nickel transport system substrate-binding protein
VKLIVSYENGGTLPFYVQINTPPFNDNRVRTALKLSVNRPQMVADALSGFGQVGNDIMGKPFPTYDTALPQRTYDPEQAKFLLKQAGHSDLSFTLYTSDALGGQLESATVWKAQAAAAGININLVQIPGATYWSNNKYLNVPIYQTNWGSSFQNWAPQALFKGATYNETHWDDPAWQSQFNKALGIVDTAAYDAAFKELEVPIWRDGGYIIWGFTASINAVSSRIKGAVPWSGFNLRPQDWWLT